MQPTRGRLAFTLAVLLGINLMNFYDRQVLGAVGEHVRIEWDLSDRQLSQDRKSTRLNSSHANISYAVFCLKKKKQNLTGLSCSRLARNPVLPSPSRAKYRREAEPMLRHASQSVGTRDSSSCIARRSKCRSR